MNVVLSQVKDTNNQIAIEINGEHIGSIWGYISPQERPFSIEHRIVDIRHSDNNGIIATFWRVQIGEKITA